jgi:FixJ family two-component response regulator
LLDDDGFDSAVRKCSASVHHTGTTDHDAYGFLPDEWNLDGGRQPDIGNAIYTSPRLQLLDTLRTVLGERAVQACVHVVDDDEPFRKAIERHLKYAGYEVATYPSAQDFLDRLPSEGEFGCILLDVQVPGLDGPALQTRLRELGSTLPIIFLTGYPDIPTTVRAIKAGADDFLTKPVSSDELLRAIAQSIAHHEVTRTSKSKLDIVRAHVSALTPREREVFLLIVRGNTNKNAARVLGCSERTIKAHRHRVMEKMQVRSVAELVSLAERVGIASAAEQTV